MAGLPSPPGAPLAGAPLANGTLFCDGESCYVYRPTMVAFAAARNTCLSLGGDLVAYPSIEVQAAVEKYFSKQVPLYSYWWVAWQAAELLAPAAWASWLLAWQQAPAVPAHLPHAAPRCHAAGWACLATRAAPISPGRMAALWSRAW